MTTLLAIFLTTALCGSLVAWRLARCPVLSTLGLGMGSWASRCDQHHEPETLTVPHALDVPRLHIVEAARRVA